MFKSAIGKGWRDRQYPIGQSTDLSARVTVWQGTKAAIIALAIVSFALIGMLRTLTGISDAIYAAPFAPMTLALLARLRSRTLQVTRELIAYIALVLLLCAWLLLTSSWSASNTQVFKDAILVTYWAAIAALTPLVLSQAVLRWAFRWIIIAGLVMATTVFFSYYSGGDLRGYGNLVNDFYLGASSILGAATVAQAAGPIGRQRVSKWEVASLTVLIAGLAMSLGRMALLATIAIIVALSLYKVFTVTGGLKGFIRAGRFAAIGIGLASALLWGALQIERTAIRLERLFGGVGNELEGGGRGRLWHEAWRAIGDSPIVGHGLGSSGVVGAGVDGMYPHNIFLQIWVDAGVVGLLLFGLLLLLPVWRFLNQRAGAMPTGGYEFFAVYCFYILSYQTSLNAYTARPIVLMGVLVMFVLSERPQLGHPRLTRRLSPRDHHREHALFATARRAK